MAEEGIAAHWHYKEGKIEARASDPNIVWLRQLLEWQKEVEDPRTFLTTLKVEDPPKRQAGKKVGSVAELVDKLRNEAKVT